MSVQQHPTGVRHFETSDHHQSRCFSGAAGTEQRNELAGRDRKIDIVDRGDATIPLLQVLQRNAAGFHVSAARPRVHQHFSSKEYFEYMRLSSFVR
ncbi:hypothetical protein [Bradyrhizobium zhanjiangense]|uniref:hypothetical protein n=1 Tax=Bradyrhizobium zhanjiangense TaxID=1325107 RepID=UPI001FDFE51D|nr:hypothetical protein [Bradyrhizobium zhanjiangense]